MRLLILRVVLKHAEQRYQFMKRNNVGMLV